jgi:hypothetical protein
VEHEAGDHRHRQQHEQHPQVLHDRHHAVVRAELTGQRDDPGRAARHQRERAGHLGDVAVERQQPAGGDADRQRPEGHQHHRRPVRGDAHQRRQLDQRPDDRADERLADPEGQRRHVQLLAGEQGVGHARHQGAEEDGGGQPQHREPEAHHHGQGDDHDPGADGPGGGAHRGPA